MFDFTKKYQGVGFNSPLLPSDPDSPPAGAAVGVIPSATVSLREGVDDDAGDDELTPFEFALDESFGRGRWIRMAFRLAKSSGSGVFGGLRVERR